MLADDAVGGQPEEGAGFVAAHPGAARIYDVHVGHVFVIGDMGVTEQENVGPRYMAHIEQGGVSKLHILPMAVGHDDLPATEFKGIQYRVTGAEITVAPHYSTGDLGELFRKGFGIPVVIA